MVKRCKNDFYPTPESAFQSFWEADKENWGDIKTVFEPAAGDGNIIRFLMDRKPELQITANELDSIHADMLVESGAATTYFEDIFEYTGERDFDVIITNPPFSLAQPIIEELLTKYKSKRVIMLLRLNFLGSQKRHNFWNKFPPSRIYVLSKRPSFTGGGTDSQEYAWFVWDNNEYKQQIKVI